MRTFVMTSIAVSVFVMAGCSTTREANSEKDNPETVLITYHVQAGKEMEFRA
jgi:hypothetical protein